MRRHRSPFIFTVSVALLGFTGCDGGGDAAGDGDRSRPSPTTSGFAATDPESPGELGPLPEPTIEVFEVPAGSRPHDVAPAPDGTVWYTAQGSGELGSLDPDTGEVREIPLGDGSRPHGVIVGPEGAAWITDGGLNAIVRVDPETDEVSRFDLPADATDANLNTAVFDGSGTLWFTGQVGIYGRVTPSSGAVEVFDAPGGTGPYGITVTDDRVFYASLAGSYLGEVDPETGDVTVIEPPTPEQGTRRVWADSRGRVWSSQWNAGQVAVYDPADGSWQEWRLPGQEPRAYSVFVDERDVVWLSDFGANAVVRFDPGREEFTSVPLPDDPGEVRQLHGRSGEVWGAESAADRIVVVRTE